MYNNNRMTAAAYATAWANHRNPFWANDSAPIGGGDWTNFVSQALYEGGWVMRNLGLEAYAYSWYSKMLDFTRKHRSKSWASADAVGIGDATEEAVERRHGFTLPASRNPLVCSKTRPSGS